MKTNGHPLRSVSLAISPGRASPHLGTLAAPNFPRCLAIALLSIFLSACAGTTTDVTRPPAITGPGNESQPLPVEGELLDLEEIERLTEVAISDSFCSPGTNERLISEQSDASTLVAIDSRLAWLAGDMATWASLLETLAKDNSEAVDFVLQEKIKQAALAEQWISARGYCSNTSQENPGPRTALRSAIGCSPIFSARIRQPARSARARATRVATMVGYAYSLSSGTRDFAVWRDEINSLEQPVAPRHLAR